MRASDPMRWPADEAADRWIDATMPSAGDQRRRPRDRCRGVVPDLAQPAYVPSPVQPSPVLSRSPRPPKSPSPSLSSSPCLPSRQAGPRGRVPRWGQRSPVGKLIPHGHCLGVLRAADPFADR